MFDCGDFCGDPCRFSCMANNGVLPVLRTRRYLREKDIAFAKVCVAPSHLRKWAQFGRGYFAKAFANSLHRHKSCRVVISPFKVWLPAWIQLADPARVHSVRCSSPVAYGSLRAAPQGRAKARNYPGTRIMIGTENGGRSTSNKFPSELTIDRDPANKWFVAPAPTAASPTSRLV